MITRQTFSADEGGVRLDAAVLARFPTSTRALVRRAIADGDVLVDGRRAPKGAKLRAGAGVEVRRLEEEADNRVAPDSSVPVECVFEDDWMMAFDKPAGMPVQPLTCRETGTLMNGVVARHPECRGIGDSPLMAGALHRIDAGTSGLVLVARTAESFAALRAQFAAQTVRKTYLALVEGAVAAGGTLENDLVHDPTLPFCRMIDFRRNRLTRGQREGLRPMRAVTAFAPVGRTSEGCEERTLLEVTIQTGVTHQIRAQLAIAGIHIVNDRLYGAFAVEDQAGHCLHALSAAFRHPASGDPVELRTPLPPWARI
ncbi:MAG: RluA family pseudouridine synthase [Kiritimatiellae bacterium]|nr:RluA family pseudouridine synthase [Kiritimatiellia bacterium]